MEHGNLLVNGVAIKDVVFENILDIKKLADWEQDVYAALEENDINEDMYYFGKEFALRFQSHYRRVLAKAMAASRLETLARPLKIEGQTYEPVAIDTFDRRSVDIMWPEGKGMLWLIVKNNQDTIVLQDEMYEPVEASEDQLLNLKADLQEKLDLIERGLKKFR